MATSGGMAALGFLALMGVSACGGSASDSEQQGGGLPNGGVGGSGGRTSTRSTACAKNQGEVRVSMELTNGVSVGDVDGDGKQDFVVATGGFCCASQIPYKTKVFRNETGTQFRAPSELFADKNYSLQAVADLNGDGLDDIAATNPTLNELAIALSVENGAAFSTQTLPLNLGVQALLARDFDADGKVDIAALGAIDGAGKLFVLQGNGDGTFATPNVVELGIQQPRFLAAGDFDGDRAPDLLLSDSLEEGIAFNRGGTFSAPPFVPLVRGGAQAVGDLDEDGIDELVAFGEGTDIRVFAVRTGGVFEERVLQAPRSEPVFERRGAPVLADFDADGHLDLVISRGDTNRVVSELEIWRGDGTGAIGDVGVQQVSLRVQTMLPSDVDGDGLLDLVVTGIFSTDHHYQGVVYGPCVR